MTDSCNACKKILNGHKIHVCINASISICVQTSKSLAGAASSAAEPDALSLQAQLDSFLCPETPMDSLGDICSKLPLNCVLAGPVASHQGAFFCVLHVSAPPFGNPGSIRFQPGRCHRRSLRSDARGDPGAHHTSLGGAGEEGRQEGTSENNALEVSAAGFAREDEVVRWRYRGHDDGQLRRAPHRQAAAMYAATMAKETLDPASVAMAMTPSVQS